MTRIERLDWYRRVLKAAEAAGPGHYRTVKRRLCQTDLFFLLVFLLKRKDVNKDWVFERCNEVQQDPDGRLDLWAREHYKSTIITFAKTIQDILVDPEETIGIFSHSRPIAKGFLRQLMTELETNQELKELFSDILWADPKRQAPKWSENDGIIVQRQSRPKESTVEAWGLVDGMPTSKHFSILVFDDLIEKRSVTNPDMIRKVTEAWELSLNLGKVGGRRRYAGTRYHFADPYREMIARGSVVVRKHPCTVEGTWPGTPVLMPLAVLTEKRRDMGLYTFGAQMLQDPTADKKQGFKLAWLKRYQSVSDAGMNKYLLCDPANEKKKESDYTSMGVVGLGPDENFYLLDGIRDRLNLKERWEALSELHRRWRPNGVGYEKYGMQADIQYFEEKMAEESYRFEITPLGGQVAKHDRIRTLVPTHEEGRWIYPETLLKVDYEGRQVDIIEQFINEEYVPFPVGLHEDFFDMLARINDPDLAIIWPKPLIKEDRYALPKKRSRRTGASAWAN